MASYLKECANRKISLAPLVKAGKMTFQDTMVYQELLYRIQVLETCKMLCKAAPITTNMNDLLLHYQLTDTLLSCMTEDRHMGFPADDKGKASGKPQWKTSTGCSATSGSAFPAFGRKSRSSTSRPFPLW